MLRRPLIALVLAALLVAACGSDETSTSTSDLPATVTSDASVGTAPSTTMGHARFE